MTDRVCGKKRTYLTRADARRTIRRLVGQGTERAVGLSVYRCPNCDRYHLGHRPQHRKGTQP